MSRSAIAHYQLGEKLGQGGMGEVYRATDTKLGRPVAVKFLPPGLAGDPVHMGRFVREAHVLASLNHPNIAAIYGVEDGALIMELVEGPTLAERIKAGAMPLEETLPIARQIADALEAAHAKGIVHRDLKPANIKITPDGIVKVLDFGLAKVAAESATVPVEESPTMALTQAGFVMGTAGYMAPEQARGREVDKRADVWAFGVVLYEMLTGTQLFQGDTVTDVMAAVVREDPDFTRVPPQVRPVLQRCLDKDPKRRLRDVGDAMLLLEAATAPQPDVPTPARPALVSRAALGIAAASLAALAALAFVHFRETPARAATVRFPLDLPADISIASNGIFSMSPDGRQVAYAAFGADAVPRIWLRSMDALTSRVLPESEIDRNSGALFWSPDSRFLAYWFDGQLKRIEVSGGPAQTIAEAPTTVLGGSWSRDDVIVFGTLEGLKMVPASGGTPEVLTKSPGVDRHIVPQFLPDGRHYLYLGGPAGKRQVYIGSIDGAAEDHAGSPLMRSEHAAIYAPGAGGSAGRILFLRDTTLLAQRFDPDSRRLSGDAERVAEQVATNGFGVGYYSASETGALVYLRLEEPGIQLTWYNRRGEAVGPVGEPGPYRTIKVSPDGTRVAVLRVDQQGNSDIWQIDPSSGVATRFTFDPAADVQPVWSSDSRRIAWISHRGGVPGFYAKRADGSGEEELLYRFPAGPAPNLTDWTRDGRFLVYNYQDDVWALPVAEGAAGTRMPVPVVQGDGGQLGSYVSPDHRWIAYISNEPNKQRVLFVQPFGPGAPAAGTSAGKWMVSNATMGMARWRADSRELLFVGGDGGVMSMEVPDSPVFRPMPPKLLFQLPRAILTNSANPGAIVDVTRDHQRFLLSMLSADASSGFKVVLNWQAELDAD